MRSFVESLLADGKLGRHAVYRGLAPGRDAVTRAPESGWPLGSERVLAALGIPALYTHQASAVDHLAAGRNVLLATPTASGKTLAYLMSYLERRSRNPDARALFVYPLKALARDQLGVIQRFLAPVGVDAEHAAQIYDGDTPDRARRKIRKTPPSVLLTNPDMLHLGILPYHDAWATFLHGLELVVIDEAHVYRGIFGAHVHHVLRRLLRVAAHHGATPRLVAGSATIGAPRAFIETLTGESFELVDQCGAPAAPRHVVFLSPITVSPYTVATRAVARAIEAGHKTIAFTKARRITELIHRWLREMKPELASRVASYRAGYLPEERREIESRLFSGDLDGVISTSALEAGIDVGGLDVCVLVGYPGSLATSWQRIGRTGRKDRESLAILVAMPDALDKYVVQHPSHFFSSEFERVVLDPENDVIADVHLQSAAAELSLVPEDLSLLAGPGGMQRIARLVEAGRLVEVHEERRWFSPRRRPQRDVPLRNAGSAYGLQHARDGRQLGTLDESRVWFEGHPGAIYLHAGRSYRVLELSAEERTITLEPAEVGYFTQVYARKETEVLERSAERSLGSARLVRGDVRVTTFIEGFGKRRLVSQEEISRHPLVAPPQLLETTAFWLELPEALMSVLVAEQRHPAGSLHAMEHAAIGLFPLLAICDRWDLGGISYARHPQIDLPAVFIYDGWPGGVGLARAGFDRAEELFSKTKELIADCPCDDGCPACVHSPKCGSGNTPLDKAGALTVLDLVDGSRTIDARERAAPADVAAALAGHRTRLHSGVRGGGPIDSRLLSADPGPASVAANGGQQPADLDTAGWPASVPRPSELLAPEDGRWLFFDVETLRGAEDVGGWEKIRDMGVALAVVLDAQSGLFQTYFEPDVERLVDDLLAADRVVGFNHERFDLTVLSGYVGDRVCAVKTLDLLREIHQRLRFRVGLGHLAQETLGVRKAADGLQSLQWVKEGRFDLIERYCRDDVMLTAALWAYGRTQGYVLYRSRDGLVGRIPARW